MGMVTNEKVGTGVNNLMGKIGLSRSRLGLIFNSPMKGDKKKVYLGFGFFDVVEDFFFQFGVNGKIVTQESYRLVFNFKA